MTKTNTPTENDSKYRNGSWRAAKWIGPLLPVIWLAAGCSTAQVKPAYPAPEAGAPASILKLDNTMADSMWAAQLKAGIGLKVTVDGFSPLEKAKLKGGGQIGATKQLLPKGVTELRLPSGSHTLVHEGKVLGRSRYYFNPVSISFDTEPGKTYVVRFKNSTTLMKLQYAVEYEGWSSEQTSQWPNEIKFANPILGR
ncbi:MAG: hypothetical protein ACLQM8_03825 [Limisphaerales bacterium]